MSGVPYAPLLVEAMYISYFHMGFIGSDWFGFGVLNQGAVLSLGAGAVVGMTFGQEIANHSLQLYRLDTMAAQVKFMEWWQKKAGVRS